MSFRPTSKDYFLTWLWFFLSTTIAGAAVGGLVGGATGMAVGALGAERANAIYVIGIASFIVGAVLSFVLFRYFVSRLVARTVASAPDAANAA
jgi:hypothetical protein